MSTPENRIGNKELASKESLQCKEDRAGKSTRLELERKEDSSAAAKLQSKNPTRAAGGGG
jgi:hypothetical protein